MQIASLNHPRVHSTVLLLIAALEIGRHAQRFILLHHPAGVDFVVIWTAARFVLEGMAPYDFAALTEAQGWLIGSLFSGARPFPYPPAFLLVAVPFGFLPFWLAYAVWAALTFALFLTAVRRLLGDLHPTEAILIALAPVSAWIMFAGQTTFLIGALVLYGMSLLSEKPIRAGLLFGIAASFKPQTLLLLPVALLAGGHYRAILWTGIGGVLTSAPATLAFGFDAWLAWVKAAVDFRILVDGNPLRYLRTVSPIALLASLGVTEPFSTVIRGLLAALGLAVTWCTFPRTRDPVRRSAALGGGSLLCAPYAMSYDAALLAPVAILLARQWRHGPLVMIPAIALYALPTVEMAGGVLAIVTVLLGALYFVRQGATPATPAVSPPGVGPRPSSS